MSINRKISFAIWITIWALLLTLGGICLYCSWGSLFYGIQLIIIGVLLIMGTFLIAPLILSAPFRVYETIVDDVNIKFYDETMQAENADFCTVFSNTTKQIFKGATDGVLVACAFMPIPMGVFIIAVNSAGGRQLNDSELGFYFVMILVYAIFMLFKTLPIIIYSNETSGKTIDKDPETLIIVREYKDIPVPQELQTYPLSNRANMQVERSTWEREYVKYLKNMYPEIADDEELLFSETEHEMETFRQFVIHAGAQVDYRNSSLYNELYPTVAKKMNENGCLTTRQAY